MIPIFVASHEVFVKKVVGNNDFIKDKREPEESSEMFTCYILQFQ